MALRSLANVYLLRARKPVTGTFPSRWKKKLIPALPGCDEALCSDDDSSLSCPGEPALGSPALITLPRGAVLPMGAVSALSKGRVLSNSPC